MKYPAVGACMYCGKARLSRHGKRKPPRFHDEHIVPLGLGGTMVLPESTCAACEKLINREVENHVMRREWGVFRDALKSPTRNKKAQAARRAKAQHGIVGLYRFLQAGILTGAHSPQSGAGFWNLKNNPPAKGPRRLVGREGDDWVPVGADWTPRPDRFARLIAKVGYAFAVAELGFGSFTPFVQGLILGTDNDYGRYVGSLERDHPISVALGDLSVKLTLPRSEIATRVFVIPVVDVAILPEATPVYYVVAGELDLNDAQQRRVYEGYGQSTRNC